MTSAAIYARISADVPGSELGVQRQEFECRELAAKHGIDVARVYVDNGLSAYNRRRRPEWERLLDSIGDGLVDTVIAWHPDRLTRHPVELESLVALLERTDTKVLTVTAGEYDLSTASGRMCARVVGAVARHESEQKGERLAAKARQLAIAGYPHIGGRRACGFHANGMDHDPEDVRLLRWAAEEILAGRTVEQVANLMPEDAYGCLRRPRKLRQMLNRPLIAGLSAYRGEVVALGRWEPIIPVEQWLLVVAALALRPPKTLHGSERVYLLSGVAEDHKGLPMLGGMAHKGYRQYRSRITPGGGGVTVTALNLETMVLAVLRSRETTRRWPLVDQWDALSLANRQALLRVVFKSIVVHPVGIGGPFIPERIVMTLR